MRNCVGLGMNPKTGELWCSTNERDMLGDNLVPDYITHVQPGGFYGWPWYYMGSNQDPRHEGKHPELKDKVIVPDVLLQPHFASLEMVFYQGDQFPTEYRGDIFAAEHGSWNRAVRTGYEASGGRPGRWCDRQGWIVDRDRLRVQLDLARKPFRAAISWALVQSEPGAIQ